MGKTTKYILLLLIIGIIALNGCGILKKNDCGCPPIPTTGKMKH